MTRRSAPRRPMSEAARRRRVRGAPPRRRARLRLPRGSHHEARPGESLDELILRAEQDLVAREQRIRGAVHALGGRLRGFAEPRRWVVSAGAALLAIGGLVWLWRHGVRPPSRAPAHAAPVDTEGRARRGAELPWVQWIGLLWPLLPVSWRARVSPGAATAVATVGIPLLTRLFARPVYLPLPTPPAVDLDRYSGAWFEVARLPLPYEPACRGPALVSLRRRGAHVDVERRCADDGGATPVRTIAARVVPRSGGARWRMTELPRVLRWLPWGWRDEWILYVDDAYTVALSGSPARDQLRVLSRTPHLDPALLHALRQHARELGFAAERLEVAVA